MIRLRAFTVCLTILLAGVCTVETASAVLRSHKPSLKSIEITPRKVVGGSATVVTGMVTLTEPADAGGDVVKLSSCDPLVASVPTSVTVLAGARSATFTTTVSQVFADKEVEITAKMGDKDRDCELKVLPFEVKSFSFNPTSVIGGFSLGGVHQTAGTVVISAPAGPGGVQVQLSQKGSSAVLPTITVPSGSTSVSFSLVAQRVSVTTIEKFVASIGHSKETALLTVLP